MSGVQDDISSMIRQALLIGAAPDYLLTYLTGSGFWYTGDNREVNISIPVPRDADVEADTLDIYLGARLYDQANPQNAGTELAFRPAMWVTTPNREDASTGYVVQDADGSFLLSDSYNGDFQGNSTPIPIAVAMSHRFGQGSVQNETITSAWPGGMRFHVPEKYKRGSTITLSVQPSFSRVQNAAIKTQFRAEVVITGRKVIRRSA